MIPNNTLQLELQGAIDYGNDSFEALLLKDTTDYSPDPTRDTFVSDVLNNADEYDDTNYQRISVTGTQVNQNDTANQAEWDADDLQWSDLGSNVGQTIQAAVVYRVGTSDSDSEVVRVLDDNNYSEFPIATNGSPVTISWDSQGVRTTSA